MYVQLRGGAAADEDELLAFATRSIGERAAVPKAVHVVAQIPLTAVGKIFKPALVMWEIEDVVRREAAGCGVAVGSVDVKIDPKRGMVAQTCTLGLASPLHAALGRYTFAVEFTEA